MFRGLHLLENQNRLHLDPLQNLRSDLEVRCGRTLYWWIEDFVSLRPVREN